MFNRYGVPINSRNFLLQWMVACVAVWLIAAISTVPLMGVAWYGLGVVSFLLDVMFIREPWSSLLLLILVLPLFVIAVGGCLGALIGFAQRWLLRRHFAYRLQNFLLGSILGGVAGIMSTMLIFLLIHMEYITKHGLIAIMPLFVTLLAVGQAWSLRPYVHGVWLWVLVNLVGGLAFSSALFGEPFGTDILLDMVTDSWRPTATRYTNAWIYTPLGLAAGILMQGAITGVAALWLFGRMARSDAPDDEMELPVPAKGTEK